MAAHPCQVKVGPCKRRGRSLASILVTSANSTLQQHHLAPVPITNEDNIKFSGISYIAIQEPEVARVVVTSSTSLIADPYRTFLAGTSANSAPPDVIAAHREQRFSEDQRYSPQKVAAGREKLLRLSMLELQRRQALRYLHKTTVYNTPLLHALVFILLILVMSRLIAKFNASYAARPLLTMMISNAILGGLADATAQTITAVRENALRKPGGPNALNDPMATEIHELDKAQEAAGGHKLVPDAAALPPPFDFQRLGRFMAYGFCMAPLQFKWFQLLSKAFPIGAATATAGAKVASGTGATAAGVSSATAASVAAGAATKAPSALAQTFKRMALDQTVFAPFGLAVFYTAMTLAEGGTKEAVGVKLRDMYVPTLKANWMVWPAVQVVNFRLMPVQFQLPFVSTVGIAWTAYLSLSNAAADVSENKLPPNSRSLPSTPTGDIAL